MNSRISDLVDGELAENDEQIVFGALRRDGDLQGNWREYILIGDALRGEKRLGTDITDRVMAALDKEPVVLAPTHRHWQRPVLAAAATLAGVGAVAWVALMQPGSQLATPSAHVSTLARDGGAAQAVQPVRQTTRDMREYLAAHQAQSGFLQFRGGTENIRSVSATGKAPAK